MKTINFLDKNKYILLIILIGLIIFTPLVITKTFFAGGDIVHSAPLGYDVQKTHIQEFNTPFLWNPYFFSGVPFSPNVIMAPNYPLNLLSIFLNLPLFVWVNLSFLITFVFAGIFTYLFSRKLKLNKFSSFISAIIFIFSHAFISRLVGYPGITSGFLFLAANFFFLENFFLKKNLPSAIFLSIFLALGFLAGHTQYFFYASFALSLYFIFRFVKEYKKLVKSKGLKKFILLCLFIGVLFLGLAAIQFIPTIEYSKYSWRMGYSFEEASKCSLPPYQSITAIIPNFFGHRLLGNYWGSPCGELAFYLGILPLILAIFAIFSLKSKTKIFFLGIAIFSILFAFGNYFPLFFIFYKFIPGFSIFNAPSRMLMVYSFALAILSGMGTENLIYSKQESKKRNFSIVLFLLFLFSFINASLILIFKDKILSFGKKLLESLYYGRYAHTSFVQQNPFSELLPLVIKTYSQISLGVLIVALFIFLTAFLFYFSYKNINKKYIKFGILLILFIDLFFFAAPYLNEENIRNKYSPGADSTEDIFNPNEEVLFLLGQKEEGLFRIYDNEWIVPQHLAVQNRIYKTTGYESIALKNYFNYLDEINLSNANSAEKLGLLNVKYIFTRTQLTNPNFVFIREFNNSLVYKNNKFLPRFYVLFNSSEIKPINLIKYNTNEINLSAKGPGTLVFSDTYYPGWNAYVNNKKTEVLEFKGIIKSIELGEEEYEIIFKFEPKSYFIGRNISLISIILIILIFGLLIRPPHV